VRPQCDGCRQAQRDEEVLQLWRNRSSRYKVLQTEKKENITNGHLLFLMDALIL